jgi:hypothetical protein
MNLAFGPSTTGILRTLTNSLRPSLNADSEMVVSVLCHEAGMTSWVALAKDLGISIKWWTPAGGMGANHDPKLTLDSLRPLLSPQDQTCMLRSRLQHHRDHRTDQRNRRTRPHDPGGFDLCRRRGLGSTPPDRRQRLERRSICVQLVQGLWSPHCADLRQTQCATTLPEQPQSLLFRPIGFARQARSRQQLYRVGA